MARKGNTVDTPAKIATDIAAEIRSLTSDAGGLQSVVAEIQDYRSTHTSQEYAEFYAELNEQLMRDNVLPEILITGNSGGKIEVHPITEELNRGMLIASGSSKYDEIAKAVEQRYKAIVGFSAADDPASTVQDFDVVYESAKSDLAPLSDIERYVYSAMLRNIILANPEVAQYVGSDEVNSQNGSKFRQIIGGGIRMLSTDPNQSDEQVARERLLETMENSFGGAPNQTFPFGQYGGESEMAPNKDPKQPKPEPEPELESFGSWM